jgi:SWIM zinc finger
MQKRYTMNTIPTISEQDILNLFSGTTFQRGQQYFSREAIFDTRRQGMTLKAHCAGSHSNVYRVEVTFGSGGIESVVCSCPVGSYCKHVVALLLTWSAQPEKFTEQEELDAILAECDKAELINLIKQMLRRDPDLEVLLETLGQRGKPANPDSYRRQVEAAFRRGGNEWGAEGDIADELTAIQETADDFLQKQEYANALVVYGAIVNGIIEHHYEYRDEEGDFFAVINACVEGLRECLEAVQSDSALRQKILRVLFDIYLLDADRGGIGLGEDAPTALLEDTTAEERLVIADWLREVIKANSTGEYKKYQNQSYGSFLLELEADTIDDEAYLRICRETGRVQDLVERLLDLGRTEEAVKEAQAVSDYEVLRLADLFVKHKQEAAIEPLLHERAWNSRDRLILEWLYRRAKARKEPVAALFEAAMNFRVHRPTLESYQQLRQIAIQFGQWEQIRPKTLASLHSFNSDLLIQIALDEGDFAPGQIVLKYDKISAYYYSNTLNRTFQTLDKLEETQAEKVILFYRQLVDYLIELRVRQSYAEACRCLIKLRDLYKKLHRSKAWNNYISELREKNSAKRALKDEMTAAGL